MALSVFFLLLLCTRCPAGVFFRQNNNTTMDTLSTIQAPIKEHFEAFKEFYGAQFKSDIKLLDSALMNVAGSKGKMMRPMLLLLAARSVGEIGTASYAAATSLELLHTASLLHDDVVDDSDERRGSPALRSIYGNRVAILTGDYLFSLALNSAALTKNVEIVEQLAMLGCALSSGEIVQLQTQRYGSYDEENYYNIIKGKTASLFASCAYIGALSAGASHEKALRFREIGELIGICFQIKDDIFDYFTDDIGKPTGSDMREGKVTLPALYVLRTSECERLKAMNEKLQSGAVLDEDEIEYLIEQSKACGGIDYALAKIGELRSKALSLLGSDIPDDCRDAFVAYIDYVINRTK